MQGNAKAAAAGDSGGSSTLGKSNSHESDAAEAEGVGSRAQTSGQPQIVLDIDFGDGASVDGLADAVGRLKVLQDCCAVAMHRNRRIGQLAWPCRGICLLHHLLAPRQDALATALTWLFLMSLPSMHVFAVGCSSVWLDSIDLNQEFQILHLDGPEALLISLFHKPVCFPVLNQISRGRIPIRFLELICSVFLECSIIVFYIEMLHLFHISKPTNTNTKKHKHSSAGVLG